MTPTPQIPAALKIVQERLGQLAGLLAFVASFALVALVVVTIISVFWRYVLRDPIFGIEDLSTMLLAVVVAGAIAAGGLRGSHINVDLISFIASKRFTRFSDALVQFLGAAISGFAAYALLVKGSCGTACGNFTPNLEIIHQPFYYLLALAIGVYSIMLTVQFIIGIIHFGDIADRSS